MIGRLGMSIKQCDDAWNKLREALQVQKSSKELLDSGALESWAKDLVREHTGNEDTPMLVPAVKAQEATEGSEAIEAVPINPNDNGNRGCKVYVNLPSLFVAVLRGFSKEPLPPCALRISEWQLVSEPIEYAQIKNTTAQSGKLSVPPPHQLSSISQFSLAEVGQNKSLSMPNLVLIIL